jgi:hypothetical protein
MCGRNWTVRTVWRASVCLFLFSVGLLATLTAHTILTVEPPPSNRTILPEASSPTTRVHVAFSIGNWTAPEGLVHPPSPTSPPETKPTEVGPEPPELNATCVDNDANAIAITGYDCATIIMRRACILVTDQCGCTCKKIRSGLTGSEIGKPQQPSVNPECRHASEFLQPVTGALAGHDMHIPGQSDLEVANTAEECTLAAIMT